VDISTANTEPFYRFYRFHEELNRHLKIITGGLGLVLREATSARETKIQLPTQGEPWGKHTEWRNVGPLVGPAKAFVSQLGVVRVLSAVEDFLIGIEAEHSRCIHISGITVNSKTPANTQTAEDESVKLKKTYKRLNWKIDEVENLLPLLEYFSLLRNCIVHRSGRATTQLATHATSKELSEAIVAFSEATKKSPQAELKLPSTLPAITSGALIPLLPRHAVLASAVCHSIALDANRQLRDILGPGGLAYMAAHHGLLAKDRVGKSHANSPQAVVNYLLTNRYHIAISSKEECADILRSKGQWQSCLKAFKLNFAS
jgi:hypothetical protein